LKLPNARAATVATEKLTQYLLSENHPVGKSKAEFFRALGFRRERPQELEAAFLHLAESAEVLEG
jgi:hypothetical protein